MPTNRGEVNHYESYQRLLKNDEVTRKAIYNALLSGEKSSIYNKVNSHSLYKLRYEQKCEYMFTSIYNVKRDHLSVGAE